MESRRGIFVAHLKQDTQNITLEKMGGTKKTSSERSLPRFFLFEAKAFHPVRDAVKALKPKQARHLFFSNNTPLKFNIATEK